MGWYLSPTDGLILAAGALVAAACALLGTFLVLRRMAMLGDAISHAILPGIAIGFLATHSRYSVVMMIGAAAAGLVTVWLVELLHRTRRVHEDTAIAVVFPALFALGVILVARYSRYVDLDPDCVIFGSIELTGQSALGQLAAVLVVNLLFVGLCYKELKLCTFDPGLGESLGISPALMHYLLMSAVSLTTVACFEAVGAILVVAFLIVPPATAYLLARRLSRMLVLAVGFGLLAATTGYFTAKALRSSVSGAMASVSGLWFLVVWLVAPRHGLLASLWRQRRLRRQFAAHLLLLHLKNVGTVQEASALSGARLHWSRWFGERLLDDLERQGLVTHSNGSLALSPAGEEAVARFHEGHAGAR